ncbi:hypothetical protein [Pseudomonas sp.]|uniref:hypothetical protein n=1 Tax=Pseudomonas sp. TaxID=306 RepID=UPI00289EB6C1|nr:hypothetical protein [Pseudomonas sp.]
MSFLDVRLGRFGYDRHHKMSKPGIQVRVYGSGLWKHLGLGVFFLAEREAV